ncbi:hypothetical protein V493_04010 [Pseudogymnoascus sp. VKM F-4281 (FW-2241)]|nr:hypothetical protein V493_04010 [Pseudogymnoascus sp. VKM F-4281 (FW-2241)]
MEPSLTNLAPRTTHRPASNCAICAGRACGPHQDAAALGDDPAELRGAEVPGPQWEGVPRCHDYGGDGGT